MKQLNLSIIIFTSWVFILSVFTIIGVGKIVRLQKEIDLLTISHIEQQANDIEIDKTQLKILAKIAEAMKKEHNMQNLKK